MSHERMDRLDEHHATIERLDRESVDLRTLARAFDHYRDVILVAPPPNSQGGEARREIARFIDKCIVAAGSRSRELELKAARLRREGVDG